MPPGPKRSATTPYGMSPGLSMQNNMTSNGFGGQVESMQSNEEAGVAIQRSGSPFGTGSGGQGSGLVSRRKNY